MQICSHLCSEEFSTKLSILHPKARLTCPLNVVNRIHPQEHWSAHALRALKATQPSGIFLPACCRKATTIHHPNLSNGNSGAGRRVKGRCFSKASHRDGCQLAAWLCQFNECVISVPTVLCLRARVHVRLCVCVSVPVRCLCVCFCVSLFVCVALCL